MKRVSKLITAGACVCLLLFSPPCLAVSKLAERGADIILSKDPSPGLSRGQLIKAFDFIETHSKSKKNLFSPHITHLPYTIEKCPALNGYLIRNLPGDDLIGRGGQKTVRKAILYGPTPTIVARCDCNASGKSEIRVLSELKGKEGIVPFLGFDSIDENQHVIYLEYFPDGSLGHQLDRHMEFSDQQLFKIALDIGKGLQVMHKIHLIHRDLHAGNILLRLGPKSSFGAVLVDFGFTRSMEDDLDELPHAIPNRNPPEVLLKPLRSIDRHLGEVYALGAVLYSATWRRNLPWNKIFNGKKVKKYCHQRREYIFEKIVSIYERTQCERIGSFLQKQEMNLPLTCFEQFQLLIFEMAHYDPEKRPSVDLVVERLQSLIAQSSSMAPAVSPWK